VSKKKPHSNTPLEEFKHLLLEAEQERLKKLEEVLNNADKLADTVGDILDDAVHRTKDKPRLSKKLYPIVEQSLYTSVQKNPQSLSDAIYPVMAPAIRKAINDAMKQMSESVNQGVNTSLSAKGLKWRFEAWRSGMSYGDVVIKNTLVYRVQECYLFHSESGILLSHVSQSEDTADNKELVSSMLTAIRDFVGDSFEVDETQSLEMIEVGDVTVLIEKGPKAPLACIVIGEPSQRIRDKMKGLLEDVHRDYGPELITFAGGTDAFKPVTNMLKESLVTELEEPTGKGSGKLIKLLGGLLFVFLLFMAYRGYWSVHWRGLLGNIEEKGGTVLFKNRSLSAFEATCILDPTLADLETLIDSSRFAESTKRERLKIHLIEVQANSHEAVVERLKKIIHSDGEAITVYSFNDTIYIAGQVVHGRYTQLVNWLPFIAGGESLNFDDLVSIELVEALEIKQSLERTIITFESGTVKLTPGQTGKIAQINTWLGELDILLATIDQQWSLEIIGSTDPEGDIQSNLELESRRAQFVIDQLIAVSSRRIYSEWDQLTASQRDRLDQLVSDPNQWRNVSFKLEKIRE